MLKRRDFLTAALGGLTAAGGTGVMAAADGPAPIVPAPSPPAPSPPAPPPSPPLAANQALFDAKHVVDAAASLAKDAYKAPSSALPNVFSKLGYDDYVAIRSRPESRVWGAENIGFALEPLHRGFIFASPMAINVVESGVARRLAYRGSDFDFGPMAVPSDIGDIGFSGFRVLATHPSQPAAEVAVFQGASFFRALAKGQDFGVMSRGLSIRTADPRGEEFPEFREVWIEKPSLATNALVIHALLDSQSVAGAYRFTLRPGDMSIIDAECTLFARVPLDNYGLSAMAGTHLLGPLDPHADDIRPSVYDFSGLQMLTGAGEWIWRPVTNRETLQVSSFVDQNPAGFGALQPERDFQLFLDDEHHWELRPSLWVEPIGDWGPGSVDLIEIPSEADINQNVVAYWRPKAVLQPGASASFAYRQFWCWAPLKRPPLAVVTTSRTGRAPGGSAAKRRFLVEFAGAVFADPSVAKPTASVTASAGSISNIRTFVSADGQTCRILFDLDTSGLNSSELRLSLAASGKPIAETWLYRWTP